MYGTCARPQGCTLGLRFDHQPDCASLVRPQFHPPPWFTCALATGALRHEADTETSKSRTGPGTECRGPRIPSFVPSASQGAHAPQARAERNTKSKAGRSLFVGVVRIGRACHVRKRVLYASPRCCSPLAFANGMSWRWGAKPTLCRNLDSVRGVWLATAKATRRGVIMLTSVSWRHVWLSSIRVVHLPGAGGGVVEAASRRGRK